MLLVELARRTAVERDEPNLRVAVEERANVVRDRIVSVDELSPGASIADQASLRAFMPYFFAPICVSS
jgi:hypothetical protein